jgi:hypothetical protein
MTNTPLLIDSDSTFIDPDLYCLNVGDEASIWYESEKLALELKFRDQTFTAPLKPFALIRFGLNLIEYAMQPVDDYGCDSGFEYQCAGASKATISGESMCVTSEDGRTSPLIMVPRELMLKFGHLLAVDGWEFVLNGNC